MTFKKKTEAREPIEQEQTPKTSSSIDEKDTTSALPVSNEEINKVISKLDSEEPLKFVPFIQPPSDRFTEAEIAEVIRLYSQEFSLTTEEAIHSISFWCQSGGYIKAVPPRKAKVNNKSEEKLQTLRDICSKVRPNGTVRQLARSFAKTIYKVALQGGYLGHLWKEFKTRDSSLSQLDLYFACEFYDGCDFVPPRVQNIFNSRNLERKKSKIPGKKGQKPSRKKGKKKGK